MSVVISTRHGDDLLDYCSIGKVRAVAGSPAFRYPCKPSNNTSRSSKPIQYMPPNAWKFLRDHVPLSQLDPRDSLVARNP